jgi:hypothetical protein
VLRPRQLVALREAGSSWVKSKSTRHGGQSAAIAPIQLILMRLLRFARYGKRFLRNS